MPSCGMCASEVAKLVNSHIYPASMTREQAGGRELVGARPERGHVNIATAGLRDRIVCARCESIFHPADDEAIRFRRHALKLDGLIALNHSSVKLPTLIGDAGKLHTFALQTLLRAALSRHTPAVPRNALSEWTAECLLTGRQTINDGPDVFIRIIRGPLGGVSMNPALHADKLQPNYALYMPNFHLYVAANSDGRLSDFGDDLVLRPGMAVTVWRSRIEPFERDRVVHGLAPVYKKMGGVFDRLARANRRQS